MQMGTQSDKVELFSKLLGFEPRVIAEVLDRNAMTLPCIYLVSLGKVKELRSSMNIPPHFADDAIVCKYGRTENFKRRLAEHVSKYNKGINNAFVRVLRYTYIDPINASSAESALAKLMNSINSRIQYRDETELVVVSRDFEDYINTQFTHLGKSFMGHTTELNARIQELENQLKQQQLEHTIELQKLQHSNEMKDVLLKYKDLEIENLKLKAVAK
jgi:predicted GIY-YIG superfamily endonuclease